MLRIALSQITTGPEPTKNLALIEEQTRRAAAAGARLVVFPEAAMACFGTPLDQVAEPLDGPWANAVREVAAAAGVVVVAGMFTPAADGPAGRVGPGAPGGLDGSVGRNSSAGRNGSASPAGSDGPVGSVDSANPIRPVRPAHRVANTLLITGPATEARYDKIHLYDAFGYAESETVAPGSRIVTVDVDGVRLGLATCYDVRFPELFRAHADAGAVATLLPASWGAGPGKREQWELLVRARALDATVWVAAVGQADPAASGTVVAGAAPTGIGYSMLAGPDGTVRSSLGPGPGLLVAELDPAEVAAVRERIPVLNNRKLGRTA